jgi:hypothetical protein
MGIGKEKIMGKRKKNRGYDIENIENMTLEYIG